MPLIVFSVTPVRALAAGGDWPTDAHRGELLVRAFSPTDARQAIMEDRRYAHPAVLSSDLYEVREVNFGEAFREAGPRGVIASWLC